MKEFYKLISSGLYPFLYPAVFYMMKKKRGYPLDIAKRFFPSCQKHYRVLFHFASLGEARTLSPLLRLWNDKLDEILFESVTPAGKRQLLKEVPTAEVKLFPFDFYPSVKRLLKKCGINRIILFETELWPSIFIAAREMDIRISVVNGKFSSSTRRMLELTAFFWREVFNIVDRWYVVEEESREFLLKYGIDEKRIRVIPDLKYLSSFREVQIDTEGIGPVRKWAGNKQVVVFGSMHRGEEEILSNLRGLDIKIIYVPRHINWVDELKEKIEKMGFKVSLYSGGDFSHGSNILIIDIYGKLFDLYSIASLAVIGGSFVPHGGHNPLEPLNFNVPVLFGKHMENFQSIVTDIKKVGVGREVDFTEIPDILKNYDEIFPEQKILEGVSYLREKKHLVEKAYLEFLKETF